MNRRDFLRRSALIAAGAVAADQLELLDRLGWVRRFFPGFGSEGNAWQRLTDGAGNGITCTSEQWDALLTDEYVTAGLMSAINKTTPLLTLFRGRRVAPRSLFAVPDRYIEVVRG